MSGTATSTALLNARYVAIRTSEAKGLTDRLLQASRDKTPGVRRLLVPLLYRYWHGNREQGWALIEQIARRVVRFSGLPDVSAMQIVGELSMPIMNACRQEPEQMDRLAAIWHAQLAGLLGTPLARALRIIMRGWAERKLGDVLAGQLKRQPAYQPVNYEEMIVTFARPDSFRAYWRDALGWLEAPEGPPRRVLAILGRTDLPYDLYLMLICERVMIYYGARMDFAGALTALEDVFRHGCAWFRGSILYALFHIINTVPDVEDSVLDRYDALALEFFTSGSWRLTTSAGTYAMATHVANADVVAARHRPGRPPRVVPALLKRVMEAGDQEQLASLFAAIDGVAFYHDNGALALEMIEQAYQLGGASVERQVVASLASVRLLNQPLLDAFLRQHRAFDAISPAQVEAAEPSVTEEDLQTLVDGFVIHMLVTSDDFRLQLCGVFRRAIAARDPREFLLQVIEWVRDELARVRRR